MKRLFLAAFAVLSCAGFAACAGTQLHSPRSDGASAVLPGEPPLDQMSVARLVGKMGVPVEVRYRLADTAVADQPTTLQLAFTPHVAGENLRVEFLSSGSVSIESGSEPFARQKTDAAGVYRHSLVVTKRRSTQAGVQGEMRVLVSMDVEGGRYFGIFAVPLGEGAPAAKSAVKQQ